MDEIFLPDNRRRLTLKRGKERVIANRHPWIFTGAIAAESGPAGAAIADLYDGAGVRVASGFYSPRSEILLRAVTFGNEELTEELIGNRVAAAIERRRPLLTKETNAVRVVNAEGDELSGLVIDLYNDVVVAEVANAGLERIKKLVVDIIGRDLRPRLIYLNNDLPARQLEQLSTEPEVIGDGSPATTIVENGLRFEVDPAAGQKTGFFLDQRENRALVRQLAPGKAVLNLFSYTGAFGVYAAAGGATSVENVDGSDVAIEQARKNHDINQSSNSVRFTVADAFAHVRKLAAAKQRFGLIVCDPPAFAKRRVEVDRAARGYKDINLYAMRLLESRGMMLTFSCSGHMSLDLFQKVIFAAALDAGRRISILRRLTAGPDHPVSIYCPEGEYLKGFLLEVRE
ncbi:MAG TPA: class I SAM-dependent rRNA methyltransferase [Thermoanaerobaculia bacterium]|nr:class I SAM-dependent rRNA methyltransferase [Thermoanaerobaculia bacterium]